MNKILLAIIPLSLIILTSSCTGNDSRYRRIEGYAQGGTFHVIYSLPENTEAPACEDSIVSMVTKVLRDIDFSISGYNSGSILSRWNRGEECTPDRYFTDLYILSRRLWEETGGLFDASGGPLFDFWGFGFKNPASLDSIRNDAETPRIIDSLKSFVGMDLLSMENGKIIKKDPRVQLNFNAIAQGYTCDMVASVLDSIGVRNYLVEVGMEIVCKGLNASGQLWSIGIDAPVDGNQTAGENIQKIIRLSDCGITTSGNYRKFYIIDGRKYAHTINPVTGYPVQQDLLSATVISSDTTYGGAMSDAYATYCMVAGKEQAAEFITSRPDLRGYLIYDGGTVDLLKDGSEIRTAYGHVEEFPYFRSRYMTPRQVYVWLPEGYSSSGKRRYDVLYMHDGQMLFDSTSTWNRQEWKVDEVAGRLMAEDSVKPFIVVGIAHGNNRYGEYFPEKALGYLDGNSPDGAEAIQYMDSACKVYEADEYLRFLTSELKPFIDSRYRTFPERNHTFTAGSSMGGLISLYALCEYPDIFGGAACMSTHLPMIAGSSYSDAPSGISDTVFDAFLKYLSDRLPEPGSCLLYTDRGDSTLDALYPPYQNHLDSLLVSRGWDTAANTVNPPSGHSWVTKVFPGDAHVERDWAARLNVPFTFLFRKD